MLNSQLKSLISDKRSPFLLSIGFHALLLGSLSLGFPTHHQTPPDTPMTVTIFEGTNPSNAGTPTEASKTSAQTQSPPAPRSSPAHTPTIKPRPTPASDVPDQIENIPDPTPVETSKAIAERVSETKPSNLPNGFANIGFGARIIPTGSLDQTMLESMSQTIANRIKTCWQAPPQTNPSNEQITVTASFNSDGTLSSPPQISRISHGHEIHPDKLAPIEQAALDAINRCSPLSLPPALYPYWKEVQLTLLQSSAPPA